MVDCSVCSYLCLKDVLGVVKTIKMEDIVMNRVFKILFLSFSLFAPVILNAQEPKNNLGKTISQLRQTFPNLRYVETRDGLTEYTSDGITFTFKNNKVVAESMGVDEGRSFGYNWFNAMMESFEKTSYKRATPLSEDNATLTRTFYYSDFWITLGYWKSDGYTTITYQNSDYFK